MTATQVLSVDSMASTALQLQQPCGYRIHNNQISINVSAIKNNRNFDNISGTLALELWALRQPYRNEQFDGVALAGTALGEIYGQHFVGPCVYDLQFHEPPTGQWYLCLMLREWTEMGYVTRDAVNFDVPYVASWKPSIIDGGANRVVHVDFSHSELEPASVAKQSEVKSDLEATVDTAMVGEAEPKNIAPVQKVAPKTSNKKAKSKKAPAPKIASAPSVVSVNNAELEQLRSIKGLSAAVAQNLLSNRPYQKLDDLLKVKGLGPKLLDKIKDHITL